MVDNEREIMLLFQSLLALVEWILDLMAGGGRGQIHDAFAAILLATWSRLG